MSGVIGKKIGMTSIFDEDRRNIPCTLIEVPPNVVTYIKTKEVNGYNAIQLGAFDKREKNTNKPLLGQFKKAGVSPKMKLMEFDFSHRDLDLKIGDTVGVEFFEVGHFVDVTGTSKGKGFQGVVKRHGFHGVGDATHGQHNRLRAPGSLGAGSTPSRVLKGMRMGGQMGNARVKVQNLRVLKVIPEKNLLVVSGAIPGSKGSIVIVEK